MDTRVGRSLKYSSAGMNSKKIPAFNSSNSPSSRCEYLIGNKPLGGRIGLNRIDFFSNRIQTTASDRVRNSRRRKQKQKTRGRRLLFFFPCARGSGRNTFEPRVEFLRSVSYSFPGFHPRSSPVFAPSLRCSSLRSWVFDSFSGTPVHDG